MLTRESGVSSVPSQRAVSAHCDACTLVQRIADGATRHVDCYTAEDVDEELLVVSAPGLVGLVVIPSHHLSGLEELPPPQQARVLAALRRVSASVGAECHGSVPRVVVTTAPPASRGHVGFHVAPRSRPRGFDT
jgi:hypothetical protein